MTIVRHFDLELADLRQNLAALGSEVLTLLTLANAGLGRPRVGLKAEAAVIEDRIDHREGAVTTRCHELLVLQTPMTRDLRFLLAATHIANDLELIGDHAESVCRRADYLGRHQLPPTMPPSLAPLGTLAQDMVKQAMDAIVGGDFPLSRQLLAEEDEADRLTKACFRELAGIMHDQPDVIPECTHLVRAVAHLEEVADLAVAIAEEGLFVHRGRTVRHRHDEIFSQAV
jgi:phosphate transport system protein